MLSRNGKVAMGTVVAVAALSLLPRTARAQAQDAEPAEPLAVSVDLGGDWTSAYYFRGIRQERDGAIFQPAVEFGIHLVESGPVSLSAVAGTWNSLHSRQTGATNPDAFAGDWYEADVYGGLELGAADWTLGAQWVTYAYPNGAAATIDEVVLSVGYDDSRLWKGKFALNPRMAYAFEVNDRGGPENSYLELGLSASHSWEAGPRSTFSIEVPLTLGLSVNDYYVTAAGQETTLGYWDLGLDASCGLPLPPRFGGWTVRAGLHYLSFGDATRELNDGDGSTVVGKFGLGLSF